MRSRVRNAILALGAAVGALAYAKVTAFTGSPVALLVSAGYAVLAVGCVVRAARRRAAEAPRPWSWKAKALAALAAVGVLYGVALGPVTSSAPAERADRARLDLWKVRACVDEFWVRAGRLPANLAELEPSCTIPPSDPWGHPYRYEPPPTPGAGRFILESLGADGAEGGTGVDEDIVEVSEVRGGG